MILKEEKVVSLSKKETEKEEGTPEALEKTLAASYKKLEEALKTVPPEQLEKAKKEVEKMLTGDLSWADLTQYTPEKLYQIAEAGYNQFKIGNYDSAERLFKGLTVIDVGNYYYHQMLGATFQRKEKLSEALLEYTMAVDCNSKDLVSLTNRGEVYFKLGLHDPALTDFDAAIALDPKNEDRWANRARMLKEQVKLVKERKK